MLWHCWLGGRKGIRSVKILIGWLLWSKVQTCMWPSWCHCHSLSLASVKSRLVLPFWYWLTWIVLQKGLLNRCVCVSTFCAFLCLTAVRSRCSCSIDAAHFYRCCMFHGLCVCCNVSVCWAHWWILQKWMNWSRCLLWGRLVWAKGTMCEVGVQTGATWPIRLNDTCMAVMWNYFDYLLCAFSLVSDFLMTWFKNSL